MTISPMKPPLKLNGAQGPYDTSIPGNYGRNAAWQYLKTHKEFQEGKFGPDPDPLPLSWEYRQRRYAPVGADKATKALNAIGYVQEEAGGIRTAAELKQGVDQLLANDGVDIETREKHWQYFLDTLDLNNDKQVSLPEVATIPLFYDNPTAWMKKVMDQPLDWLKQALDTTIQQGNVGPHSQQILDVLSSGFRSRTDGLITTEEQAVAACFKSLLQKPVMKEAYQKIYQEFDLARYE